MSHRITVSKRMISYMRSGWRQLCEKIRSGERGTEFGSYNSIEDMQERLTWSGALMILKGIKFSDDDAWLEAEGRHDDETAVAPRWLQAHEEP
jgi:hypothetical protein